MKNRGRPKNKKGNRRRFLATQVPQTRPFDAGSVPAGFVIGRLGAELEAVMVELKQGRQLLRAVHDLAKREPYSSLVMDLEAQLSAYEQPAKPPEGDRQPEADDGHVAP